MKKEEVYMTRKSRMLCEAKYRYERRRAAAKEHCWTEIFLKVEEYRRNLEYIYSLEETYQSMRKQKNSPADRITCYPHDSRSRSHNEQSCSHVTIHVLPKRYKLAEYKQRNIINPLVGSLVNPMR